MKYLTHFVSLVLDRNPFRIVFPIVRVALVFGLSVFIFNLGFAQTPEQLQQLNLLPLDQRQALMQELGLEEQQQNQEPLEFPNLVNPLPEVTDDAPFRFSPGDKLIVEFAQDELVNAAILESVRIGNPYELDANGFLLLPGFQRIQVAGLSVAETVVRIGAEPQLEGMQPLVTFLPLQLFGIESLERFGYELFSGVPTTFAPATDVPVPSEYIMGPGDAVNVLLFGTTNVQYGLVVSREGTVNFPEIGPISATGLSFDEFRAVIEQTVEEQMIGVSSSVTLGELRSIRIFVLGDVQQPGSYTVSGLSTITNALFVSGGINDIGSLRHIELRRRGETVSTLDLYDLLLRGDTSADERLQPGDVIFAPPIRDSISVYGEVLRPAIYELNGENNVEAVITLAGGLRPNADVSGVKLERFVFDGTTVLEINLTSQARESHVFQDGDALIVPSRAEQLSNAVRLSGNVFRSGLYPWYEGLTMTGLIGSKAEIKPGSDLSYVLIKREIEPNVRTEVFSVDLQSAWNDPGGTQDVVLQSRDIVYVFDQLNSRQEIIPDLLDELQRQGSYEEGSRQASILGEVEFPGNYPLERDMTILSLLKAGGGFAESAFVLEAELLRYSVNEAGQWQSDVLLINMDDVLAGLAEANISILPYDILTVQMKPDWNIDVSIELTGEVVFPGTYFLRKNETLSSIIDRAGGLTEKAFLEGALFTRESLLEREALRLETLANQLELDLLSLSATPEDAQASAQGMLLVGRLRNTTPVGRLVIDLRMILEGETESNILLRENDQLYIPQLSEEISVVGEVYNPTSHLFELDKDRDSYVEGSGGVTENASEQRIYIVSASGAAKMNDGSLWFKRNRATEIQPGDTIVVPIDASASVVPNILAATQVIYNIAIATAAINSF